tara:strand:+ start:1538 stop:3016 length:1479 start_codon:yes stop_codon:yes gene_type:complete
MEILLNLPNFILNLFTFTTVLIILSGVFLGILLGALPGFGSAQSLAILFPLTFIMSTSDSLIFLLAVYSAAEYGGSIPAILIKTPGTPANAISILDGYTMAQKGEPKRALQVSLISGVIGGLTSTLIFIVSGTTLAYFGLKFGPGEMFALGIFGLSIIGTFFGKNIAKGFFATGLGLLLATVGTSGFGGMRFVFDQAYLMDGIPLVVIVIGLLACPEAFKLLVDSKNEKKVDKKNFFQKLDKGFRLSFIKRLIPTWIRCSLLGTLIGAIPGAGAAIGSMIAYTQERKWSKLSDKFGTGIDEGIAAPETANNSVVAGTLIPTLALGIPGSGAAAILIGLMISKGVVPGPFLFVDEKNLISLIFGGLIFTNLFLLCIGFFATNLFAKVTSISKKRLGCFVMILIIIGTYSYSNYGAHVLMALILGFLGYVFMKVNIPPIPIVLGFVMSPIIEQNLNRALTIHNGDLTNVLFRPITMTILFLALITIIYGVTTRR